MVHSLQLPVLGHCETSHYYRKLSHASLAAAQIKNDFSFHSQNVSSDIYTLGIQGRSFRYPAWKSRHEIFTPFPSGPPMLQFCVGFAWNIIQEIFSFSCCLEEEVADGSRVVNAVVVVLVQITKKPLSESVIVLNFNKAVNTQGKSFEGIRTICMSCVPLLPPDGFYQNFPKAITRQAKYRTAVLVKVLHIFRLQSKTWIIKGDRKKSPFFPKKPQPQTHLSLASTHCLTGHQRVYDSFKSSCRMKMLLL